MRDRKPLAVNEHGGLQLADPKRRAAARAIDAVVTIVLALAAFMVAGFAAAFVSLSMGGLSGDDDALYGWLVLFSLLALVPVAGYEVAATARRGQTFGKRCMGLRVVVWDEDIAAPAGGAESVDARRSIERWAVPHGSGLLAGVVAGVVAAPKIGAYGLLVGADTWLVVSMVIYIYTYGDTEWSLYGVRIERDGCQSDEHSHGSDTCHDHPRPTCTTTGSSLGTSDSPSRPQNCGRPATQTGRVRDRGGGAASAAAGTEGGLRSRRRHSSWRA